MICVYNFQMCWTEPADLYPQSSPPWAQDSLLPAGLWDAHLSLESVDTRKNPCWAPSSASAHQEKFSQFSGRHACTQIFQNPWNSISCNYLSFIFCFCDVILILDHPWSLWELFYILIKQFHLIYLKLPNVLLVNNLHFVNCLLFPSCLTCSHSMTVEFNRMRVSHSVCQLKAYWVVE